MEKKLLTYEDFGAVGDGVTDDFDAIIACHDEANKIGAAVKAKDGATYYIGLKARTAVIRTNTDFGKAKFIVDDRGLDDIKKHIFHVVSDHDFYPITIDGFNTGTKKLSFPHEGRAFVVVKNSNQKMFIRRGVNSNGGVGARDEVIVDGDGNVMTHINWDLDEITEAYAKSIEDEPLTVKGGIFTTIANEQESFYNYHARGIRVLRSNVTLKDLTHYVTGEGTEGAPYGGFITAYEVANFTMENCIMTPHLIYYTESHIPGRKVAMGSYDISIGSVINARFIGVIQTVNIKDERYWGIFTSNFCKDVYFENCVLSRFDAHMGVTNITLKSCAFGHQCINLIGHGEAVIEGCNIYGARISDFRFDYGSIWNGNVTVRNCTLTPPPERNPVVLFTAVNSGDHDFGYKCCQPHSITIDGLKIMNGDNPEAKFYILPDYDTNFYPLPEGDTAEGKPFPYEPTHKVTVKNVSFEVESELEITNRPELYDGLIVER
jgi:hypothetical protein